MYGTLAVVVLVLAVARSYEQTHKAEVKRRTDEAAKAEVEYPWPPRPSEQ
jgi:hypothetical protein